MTGMSYARMFDTDDLSQGVSDTNTISKLPGAGLYPIWHVALSTQRTIPPFSLVTMESELRLKRFSRTQTPIVASILFTAGFSCNGDGRFYVVPRSCPAPAISSDTTFYSLRHPRPLLQTAIISSKKTS
jgi:hypothetical protein